MKNNEIIEKAIKLCTEKMGDYEPDEIHWIEIKYLDISIDYGEYRCSECAEKRKSELEIKYKSELEKDPDSSIEVFECYSQEREGPASCEDCDVMLNYFLCDVEDELKHYEDNGIDLNNQEECFSLIAVMDCYDRFISTEYNEGILKLAKLILEAK